MGEQTSQDQILQNYVDTEIQNWLSSPKFWRKFLKLMDVWAVGSDDVVITTCQSRLRRLIRRRPNLSNFAKHLFSNFWSLKNKIQTFQNARNKCGKFCKHFFENFKIRRSGHRKDWRSPPPKTNKICDTKNCFGIKFGDFGEIGWNYIYSAKQRDVASPSRCNFGI